MRTKHVLMAMALPALFAACTSDEFMEQPAQGNLDGRAVLGNLQVNVADDATTRFAWENLKWSFEDGDQFGAAVTDPTTLGTVVNTHMLGNYIFSKNGGSYTTTSQMVAGTYMFYSYNQPESFVTKNNRDLIKFDLTTQTADLNDPEKVVSENQLFISPLYFIEAENTTAENTIELPLRFIPYWSTAAFRIKNSTGADFSISQIVLNGTFNAKGEIDPTEIEKAKLYYSVPEGGDAYELTALNPDGTKTDAQVEELYEAAYMNASFAKTATLETANSLVLNCNDYVLGNGEEVVAYMQVPAGKQTNMTASIIVRVDGVSKEIEVTESKTEGNPTGTFTIASTGINTVSFNRNATRAVFGVNSDKTLKVLDVKKENLQDAGGFYVDSNAELINVLDSERGDIKIYNTGDVKVNDQVIELLNSYYAGEVTFANPIDIAVEDEEGLTLESEVVFNGAVTVESGIVGLGADVSVSGTNVPVTVKEGSKLVLAGANVANAKVIVEGGELQLATANIKVNEIDVNSGTLNITANQTIGSTGIASLGMTADDKKTTTLNIAGTNLPNGKVTLTVSDSWNMRATKAIINQYAKINATAALGIYSDVENNGEISGTSSVAVTLDEDATITNYGTLKEITNNGLIKMMDYWTSNLTLNNSTAGTGLIDNTIGKDLGTTTGNTVYSYSTGSISTIPAANVDVVVLNGTTVADGTEFAGSGKAQTILLLGNNTFGTMNGEGVTIDDDTNLTLQIGLAASADQYQTLAEKAAGITFTTQLTPTIYSTAMTTTVNAGTITVSTLKCYGGTNRNAGTITATTKSPEGTWQGNDLN